MFGWRRCNTQRSLIAGGGDLGLAVVGDSLGSFVLVPSVTAGQEFPFCCTIAQGHTGVSVGGLLRISVVLMWFYYCPGIVLKDYYCFTIVRGSLGVSVRGLPGSTVVLLFFYCWPGVYSGGWGSPESFVCSCTEASL